MLAIPESIDEMGFMQLISSHTDRIKKVTFLKDLPRERESFYHHFLRALIYFDKPDSADNFFYEFHSKSFPTNKFEFMYCVFIDQLYYEEFDCLKSFNILSPVLLDPNKEQSELFCCPLCLEKLDTASTGVYTVVNMVSVDRWQNYRKHCPVCKKIENLSEISCLKCKSKENVWCCMICGFTGCDRYQQGHAVEHFNKTLHRYSIHLGSQRIWDYLGDGWVHRLIKIRESESNLEALSTNTIVLNEQNTTESPNSKEFLMRIENIISEYNYVLSSQLEEQRKYYEKEVTRLNEKNESEFIPKVNLLTSLQDEYKKKESIKENTLKLTRDIYKKLNQHNQKKEEVDEKIKFNKDLIENIKLDLKQEQIHKPLEEDFLKLQSLLKAKQKKKEELQKKLEEMYNKLNDMSNTSNQTNI